MTTPGLDAAVWLALAYTDSRAAVAPPNAAARGAAAGGTGGASADTRPSPAHHVTAAEPGARPRLYPTVTRREGRAHLPPLPPPTDT